MTAEDQGKRLLTALRKWSWLHRLTVWLFALGAVINLLGMLFLLAPLAHGLLLAGSDRSALLGCFVRILVFSFAGWSVRRWQLQPVNA